MKQTSNAIYLSECLEELDQLLDATISTTPIFKETYEILSSKMGDCHDEVDNTVNEANEKYIDIIKKADVFVSRLKLDDSYYENYMDFKNNLNQ